MKVLHFEILRFQTWIESFRSDFYWEYILFGEY